MLPCYVPTEQFSSMLLPAWFGLDQIELSDAISTDHKYGIGDNDEQDKFPKDITT